MIPQGLKLTFFSISFSLLMIIPEGSNFCLLSGRLPYVLIIPRLYKLYPSMLVKLTKKTTGHTISNFLYK